MLNEITRILIAEDHKPTREALQTLLTMKGFSVTTVSRSDEANDVLSCSDAPPIALIDWMLPGASGLEVCRTARRRDDPEMYVYLIVITARDGEEDIAEAMAASADDFIHKPCGVPELFARVRNGERTIALQRSLARRIAELEKAAEQMRQLKRLLPICMYCKKVRDDSDYWQDIDVYIREQTGTDFSHGICPSCIPHVAANVRAELAASPARHAAGGEAEDPGFK